MFDTQDLLTAGLHLGHKKQRTHPKTNKYIYNYEKGVAIFDLFKTQTQLNTALAYLKELKKDNKNLIIVATKNTISDSISQLAKDANIEYLTDKWIGGFLTNFSTIKKNIDNINEQIKQRDSGEWDKLIKHERLALEKQLNKNLRVYKGVLTLTKIPTAMFIIDIKKEKNAVSEASKTGVKTIAVCDSNVNPELVDYPISANDDALSSVEFITRLIIEAYRQSDVKTPENSKSK